MCVFVCLCVWGVYMHRSAVLEEKQDTAPHLILSHILCMPVMSGRELGCVCELHVATDVHTVSVLPFALRYPKWYLSAFGALLCRSDETFKVLSGFVQEIGIAGL